MKKWVIVLLSILVLVGCSAKTAEQRGEGISMEMADSLHIKHISLIKYVNGQIQVINNVINADNSAFEKGEIIHFDVSPYEINQQGAWAISYSENIDGTNGQITNKLGLSDAQKWVHLQFTEEYELKIIDME